MKELNVNKEACIGCGACVAIDPEHFDFDDDGLSSVISKENYNENTENALSSCPTSAISFVEKECDNPNCHCDNCKCGNDCHCE